MNHANKLDRMSLSELYEYTKDHIVDEEQDDQHKQQIIQNKIAIEIAFNKLY